MQTTRRGFFGLLAASVAALKLPRRKVAYVTDADVIRVYYPDKTGVWVFNAQGDGWTFVRTM